MSYIEKMCFVNWRFRSFVQYIKCMDQNVCKKDITLLILLSNGTNIGVAPITHLRTCVIKIATFKGGNPMLCTIRSLKLNKQGLYKPFSAFLWEVFQVPS